MLIDDDELDLSTPEPPANNTFTLKINSTEIYSDISYDTEGSIYVAILANKAGNLPHLI